VNARARSRGAAASASLVSLVSLASLASLGAAGCGREPDSSAYFGTTSRSGKDPHTLYVNSSGEPEYLDPGKCSDTLSGSLIVQLFEGLTRDDPRDGHPVQGVATRWDQSDDNRLFRFYLRPDARWSDGKRVTAYDFAYAWRRVLRPSTASRAITNLYPLKNGELWNQGRLLAMRERLPLRAAPRPDAPAAAELAQGAAVRVLDRPTHAPGEPAWALVERYDDLPTFGEPRARAAGPAPKGFVLERSLVEDDGAVGVRALDDLTLDVELEQPTPYFIGLTSYPTLFPVRRDVIEALAARGEEDLWVRPENIVSNGPYQLEEWKFRYEITMRRNPSHYDYGRLKVHRIVWVEVEEQHTLMNLYKAGEIDYLGDNAAPAPEYLPIVETKRDFAQNQYLGIEWYEFNTRKPPLDDARVRHALDLSVDKAQLIAKVTHGGQIPATHYVPDFTGLGYSRAAAAEAAAGTSPFPQPEAEFDPERARALLRDAGYTIEHDGDGYVARGFPSLEVMYNNNEDIRNVAIAIQNMWRQNLGVHTSLRNEEWKVILNEHNSGQFQVIRLAWTADFDHPQTFLDLFRADNPNNNTGWSDPVYDATVRAAAAAPDPAEGIRLYRKAEAMAVRAMPRMPLYFDTRSTLVKPWVKGFWGSALHAHLLAYLWIDLNWAQNPQNEPAFEPPELPPPGRLAPR
jgi:oligopeptide transport system substrate-binding protein